MRRFDGHRASDLPTSSRDRGSARRSSAAISSRESSKKDEGENLRGAFTVELDNGEDFGKVNKKPSHDPLVLNIHGGGIA